MATIRFKAIEEVLSRQAVDGGLAFSKNIRVTLVRMFLTNYKMQEYLIAGSISECC
jgi:hypothetical protein